MPLNKISFLLIALLLNGCVIHRPWNLVGWRMDGCFGPDKSYCKCWQSDTYKPSLERDGFIYMCSTPGHKPDLAICTNELRQMPIQPNTPEDGEKVLIECMAKRGWIYTELISTR
jgi:hypothetical protein